MDDKYISYGDVIDFSKYTFDFFNGKINYLFPLKKAIISYTTDPNIYAYTVGDIMVLYPHNMLMYFQRSNITNIKIIKGIIIDTILHELFHSMQDFDKYIKMDNAQYLIEMSNEAKTIEELCKILNNPYLAMSSFDFDLSVDISQYDNFLQYYYQIDSPLSKALYWLKAVLGIRDDINSLLSDSDTVILNLKDIQNNTLVSNPIILNSRYTHYNNIMSVLSPIFINKINGLINGIRINYYKNNDISNTTFIDIIMDTNNLNNPIIYLPNGTNPIEKIDIL